jgi:hypothetical protein
MLLARGGLFALVAFALASGLVAAHPGANFSRPFNSASDDKIVYFLNANPTLPVQLSDMQLMRWLRENERLVQGLVLPLLFDQRVTLLVARFHAYFSSSAIDPFLDKFIDTIDETPWHKFMLEFVVAPSYPLYQTFKQLESVSSLDESLQCLFMVLSLIEVLRLLAFVLNHYVSKQTSGASFSEWVLDQVCSLGAVVRFGVVSLFSCFSHLVLWNPAIRTYNLRVILTTIMSLLFGIKVKAATSHLGLALFVSVLLQAFLYSATAAINLRGQIPIEIISNCVLIALPLWYSFQMYHSLQLFFKNLRRLFRLLRRAHKSNLIGDDKLVPFEDVDFSRSEVLGMGGCGTVVTARYFSSKVAVKFINPNDDGSMPSRETIKDLEEEVDAALRQQLCGLHCCGNCFTRPNRLVI